MQFPARPQTPPPSSPPEEREAATPPEARHPAPGEATPPESPPSPRTLSPSPPSIHGPDTVRQGPTPPPSSPPQPELTPPPRVQNASPMDSQWEYDHHDIPRRAFVPPFSNVVEDPELYEAGGWHPVHLGEVIAERYRVFHKLGHGGFATVWLARDLDEPRYVALKIAQAQVSLDDEVAFLQHACAAATAPIRVSRIYGRFTINGPNGNHQCLVTDFTGPSLRAIGQWPEMRRPGLEFARKAAHSLARTVAALHACGMCHGDITAANVLFPISNVDKLTEAQLYHLLGEPDRESLETTDGSAITAHAPSYLVNPPTYVNLAVDRLSSEPVLIDFGQAYWHNNPPAFLGVTAIYSAPELSFSMRPSTATDIWTLGCVIFELHLQRQLFFSFTGERDETLSMAVNMLGPLPESWRASFSGWRPESTHFEDPDDWWFDQTRPPRGVSLDEGVTRGPVHISKAQRIRLLALLKRMLRYEPAERIDAATIAADPWFTEED